MKDPEEKNEYRHKQAVECHSAAAASKSTEVRRAFLELEQGWLQLLGEASATPGAPGFNNDQTDGHKPAQRKRRKQRKRGVTFSMNG